MRLRWFCGKYGGYPYWDPHSATPFHRTLIMGTKHRTSSATENAENDKDSQKNIRGKSQHRDFLRKENLEMCTVHLLRSLLRLVKT